MTMQRRIWLKAACAGALVGMRQGAQAQPSAPMPTEPSSAPPQDLPRIVVLDFELVDDQDNPLTKAAQEVRLRDSTRQLQQELGAYQLYRIVDPASSQALQQRLRSQQAYLYRCDDCADQVGRLLGTDLVMATWVQKVSELILNLNVQIWDVTARRVIFSKSVDMRGNTDQSWTRAVHYLVRDMAEKRARNPRYGR